MKPVLLYFLVFVMPQCYGQHLAAAQNRPSMQGISVIDQSAFEALGTNDLILKKQKKLLALSAPSTIKVNENDISPTIYDLATRTAVRDALANYQNRMKSVQRVVKSEDVGTINAKETQENIAAAFCDTEIDPKCKAGIKAFGAAIMAAIASKSPTCKSLQAAVSEVSGLNDGNADLVPIDQLGTVAAYYNACTTSDLPEAMQRLIGIVIDLDHPSGATESGVIIDAKAYAPIGMAVQISPSRIYTARHVLYMSVVGREFADARSIDRLRFIPFSSPLTPLRLRRESHPASLSGILADVPYDQAILDLSAPFVPDKVKWPVVRRADIVPGAPPTSIYVAGFHMTLARAEAADHGKPSMLAGAKWTQYVRRDASSTCARVTQTADGCMLHSCDTIGGLSGAPIFAREVPVDNAPQIIGLHRGSAFNSAAICSAGAKGKSLNVAALPDAVLLQN